MASDLVTGHVNDGRRYDEREVALILKRVAELSESGGDARALSRGEIEGVVAELGFDKALVAQAASELALPPERGQRNVWLGGKTELLFELEVPHELADSRLEAMFEVLRRALGDAGELREQGRTRIWETTRQTTRRISLTIVPAPVGDGVRTRVRLEERMPMDARNTVGGGAMGGMFAGVLSTVPLKVLLGKTAVLLGMPFTLGGGIAVGALIGRAIWRRVSAQREDQLAHAWREIVALANQTPLVLSA